MCSETVRPGLTEGEGVGLDAGVEEGDLEGALDDGAGPADELAEPRFGDPAVARGIDVNPTGSSRWLFVDAHTKPDDEVPGAA